VHLARFQAEQGRHVDPRVHARQHHGAQRGDSSGAGGVGRGEPATTRLVAPQQFLVAHVAPTGETSGAPVHPCCVLHLEEFTSDLHLASKEPASTGQVDHRPDRASGPVRSVST
jgi:hypothetical protein